MTAPFDAVIAGAGPVGLALTASLADLGAQVAVVDRQPEAALAEPAEDGREIALTRRSVAILRDLGAWSRIPAEAVAPLRRMQVLNGPSTYAMHFGGAGQPGEGGLLGCFVANRLLRRALHDAVRARPGVRVIAGAAVTRAEAGRDATRAVLSDGTALPARLVVAADARRSPLRAQQGIPAAVHDYRQRMLVCPVEHPLPHGETTTAWFEYGRTLVTLPLNGNRSSAVLTLPPGEAERLLGLDDAAFGAALTRLYRGRLGAMRPVGARHLAPVVTAYAGRFAAPRFALAGDAAVGMHPTTAHGFNFGLLGQAALAQEIGAALAAGRDPGDPGALRRYEAAHRGETRLFWTAAEAVMRLYAGGESLPARLLRDGALRIGNLPPFRRVLEARMRNAGQGDVPARGSA